MALDKEKLTEEMLISAHLRFPDLRTRSQDLPVMHFHKTKCTTIKDLFFAKPLTDKDRSVGEGRGGGGRSQQKHVELQNEMDLTLRIGNRTENLVERFLQKFFQSSSELLPMFRLYNYSLDDYLRFLDEKEPKVKKKKAKERSCLPDKMTVDQSESSLTERRQEAEDGGLSRSSDTRTNGPAEADDCCVGDKTEPVCERKGRPQVCDLVTSNNDDSSKAILDPYPDIRGKEKDASERLEKGGGGDYSAGRGNNSAIVGENGKPCSERIESTCDVIAQNSTRGPEPPLLKEDPKPKPKKEVEEDFQALSQRLAEAVKLIERRGPFPCPRDFTDKELRRAEYDVLIISPDYGIIVIEVKTVVGRCGLVPRLIGNSPNSPEGGGLSPDQPDTFTSTSIPYKLPGGDDSGVQTTQTGTDSSNTLETYTTAAATIAESVISTTNEAQSSASNTPGTYKTTGGDNFQADFRKTVFKAVKQLQRASVVLRYLTSDLPNLPRITKILALPYVSRSQVSHALQDDSHMAEALCQCLETSDLHQTLTRCLCADEVNGGDLEDAQETWWTEVTSGILGNRDDPALPWDTYEQLIGRFCGRYSEVKGHSVADCVHLTGIHIGRNILRQEQKDIVDSDDDFVFLMGPPGSGKTLVLGLKAVKWAQSGDAVIIFCTQGVRLGSLISWQLYQRVVETLGGSATPMKEAPQVPAEDQPSGASNAANKKPEATNVADNKPGITNMADKKPATANMASKKLGTTHVAGNKPGITNMADKKPANTNLPSKKPVTTNVANKKPGTTKVANKKPGTTSVADKVVEEESQEDGQSNLRSAKKQGRPKKKKTVTKQKTEPNFAENVKLVPISPGIMVGQFVQEVVEKHVKPGQHMRFIIDESMKQATWQSQFAYLSTGLDSLKKIETAYREMVRSLERRLLQENETSTEEEYCIDPLPGKTAGTQDDTSTLEKQDDTTTTEKQDNTTTTEMDATTTEIQDITTTEIQDTTTTEKQNIKAVAIQDNTKAAEKQDTKTTGTQDDTTNTEKQDIKATDIQRGTKTANKQDSKDVGIQEAAKTTEKQEHKPDETEKARDEKLDMTTQAKSPETACSTGESKPEQQEKPYSAEYQHIKELLKIMDRSLWFMSLRHAQLDGRPGSPALMHSEQWRTLVDASVRVYHEVMGLQARLHVLLPWWLQMNPPDSLELEAEMTRIVESLMVHSLGQFFHAHNNTFFFVMDQLYSALKSLQSSADQSGVSVWVSTNHRGYRPEGFIVKQLTKCLRCPPAVQEILSLTEASVNDLPMCEYTPRGTDCQFPLPVDGPDVKWIDHGPHMMSHMEVNDCPLCGQALASYLLDDLKIGSNECLSNITMEDVMIVGSPIHNSRCSFVQQLQNSGINIQFENQELKTPPPYPDHAFILGGSTAQGLEAKILVFVPEIGRIDLSRNRDQRSEPTPPSPVAGPMMGTASAAGHTPQLVKPSSENYVNNKRHENGDQGGCKDGSGPMEDERKRDDAVETFDDDKGTENRERRVEDADTTITNRQMPKGKDNEDSRQETKSTGKTSRSPPQISPPALCEQHRPSVEISSQKQAEGIEEQEKRNTVTLHSPESFQNKMLTDACTCSGPAQKETRHFEEAHSRTKVEENPGNIQKGESAQETPRDIQKGVLSTAKVEDTPVTRDANNDLEKIQRLGDWNCLYLWKVASRCMSQLVIIHI